jgi:hypothetical protein
LCCHVIVVGIIIAVVIRATTAIAKSLNFWFLVAWLSTPTSVKENEGHFPPLIIVIYWRHDCYNNTRIKRGRERSSLSCLLVATQQLESKKRWGEELPSKFIIVIVRGNKGKGKEDKMEEEEEGQKKGWGWQW